MPLDSYRRKRDFKTTPEPSGKKKVRPGKALVFVVQKHEATRLHYDFRLELDGVMLSWAVPKGPSLKPGDKRLAIQTEDHPMEYNKFEGKIPKGNYGAGTVMIWDEGVYCSSASADRKESEKHIRAGLAKGHISFVVAGKKLKGEFALVRLKKAENDRTWLLLKADDAYATGSRRYQRAEKSAVTGRSMKEIRGKRVHPMLATLVEKPSSRDGWIYEVKWDGYRAIAEKNDKRVALYSRNGQPFEEDFAAVVQALKTIKHDAILDGEVVVFDEDGRSSFQRLQNHLKTGSGTLAYCVFDLLQLDGKDLRSLPLVERKKKLEAILPKKNKILRYSSHVRDAGVKAFEAATAKGLEGVIAKDGDSPYREGARTREWQKFKAWKREEAIICGFTEPRGSRHHFGALILGQRKGGKLEYIGHTGTGFDARALVDISKKLKPLIRREAPFETPPRTNTPATWVEPRLLCEVSFLERTNDGSLRHPAFIGLRGESKLVLSGSGSEPKFTNLDKIYWPKEKITKGDLIDYYRRVAPFILPYLKDRPESLNRYPDGIQGESFYQKNVTGKFAEGVRTVKVHSESGDKDIQYLVCDDEETLLKMANLGCIEIHPWNSRVGHLDEPDWVVIDLDPDAIAFDKVVEAALETRKVLDAAEVESYPKTSGATGIHIYVPLAARYEYEQVKQFAEIVANLVHERLPKTTSVVRNPEKRRRKIYMDFLQNRRGQTLAAPYSVRPRPGAPVSTPLEWKEVNKRLDPTRFTIETIFKRLDDKGDLFKPVLGEGADLKQALANLVASRAGGNKPR